MKKWVVVLFVISFVFTTIAVEYTNATVSNSVCYRGTGSGTCSNNLNSVSDDPLARFSNWRTDRFNITSSQVVNYNRLSVIPYVNSGTPHYGWFYVYEEHPRVRQVGNIITSLSNVSMRNNHNRTITVDYSRSANYRSNAPAYTVLNMYNMNMNSCSPGSACYLYRSQIFLYPR